MASVLSRLCLLVLPFIVSSQKKPNIIFIISDDLGYDDLGYSESHQINTPNIAKLRSEGRFLEWYYGQPNCSPTRSTIQTGRFSIHTGINSIIKSTGNYGVGLENLFMANILQQNGYATHAVGKWHMGMYKWSYTPTFRGFQSFYGYYQGSEDYYTHRVGGAYDFHEDNGLRCGPNCSRIVTEAYQIYSAYLFTERAIDIIKNHNKTENPLFLYLAYQSVHDPTEVPKQYKNAYNGIIDNPKRKLFAGMVSCMDEGIGNVTSVLEEYGYLNENTIIVFTSDNGGPIPNNTGSTNWPLRGGKRTIWEGGTRLTAFLWTTEDIMSDNSLRGGNYTQLMHIADWWPTLVVGAAGISMPQFNYSLDGVNQWKGLIGKDDTSNDKYFYYRDFIYYDHNIVNHLPSNYSAYRKGWNKIMNGTGGDPKESGWNPPPTEYEYGYDSNYYNRIINNISLSDNDKAFMSLSLYNISNDPYEFNNISKDNVDLVEQLYQEMNAIWESRLNWPSPPVDKNCPKVMYPNNSVVGPTWVPWCGI